MFLLGSAFCRSTSSLQKRVYILHLNEIERKNGTCIFLYGSRPISSGIDCKDDSTKWINPPIVFIAKNSRNQANHIRYHIKVMILQQSYY